MKKAFTLIELLVVIAIIAILAAILFPVFAQAKLAAKKTSDLSNIKQLNTSLAIYQGDSDDVLPLTVPSNLGTTLFTMPVDRTASANPGNRQAFYGNAIQPYVKNWQMYSGPAAVNNWEPFGVLSPKPIVDHGYHLNSYLNSWNGTASQAPAKVITFYSGSADYKTPGFGYSFPLMYVGGVGGFLPGTLPATTPYIFQSSGANCVSNVGIFTGTFVAPWKWNTFGTGSNVSYLDGHAKFAKFGSVDFPWLLNTDGTFRTWWISGNGCNYAYSLAPDIAQ